MREKDFRDKTKDRFREVEAAMEMHLGEADPRMDEVGINSRAEAEDGGLGRGHDR